jgi:hypothetical protein
MPKKLDPKPRPRPDIHEPEPVESDAGARLNKARIAFEAYKKRVDAPAGHVADAAGAAGHTPPPHAYPFPPGIPYGFVPPTAMPAWPAPPAAGPKAAGSLIESLGTLVHLSIQAINAGLAGGIALMQGGPREAEYACGCHDRCGCEDNCGCGCGCKDDCCRPHHGGDCGCGCHPSVHGC